MDGAVLLLVVVASLAVSGIARKLGWPAPLLLIVMGLGVSFVPGLPPVGLDPDLVLFAILPPLLYSAALDSSYLGLRANVRPIALLSVGLVLFTTAAVGLVAYLVVPGLPLAAAFVLGAVVSPPDAVAAMAIGRRLGLPRKVMTLLAGESLINDATALTAYRVAIAVVIGTGASMLSGLEVFAIAAVGGIAVGAVVGFAVHRVRMRIGDPALESAIGLVVPFGAYLAAEELHASGVLAVVVAGLYLGHNAPRGGYATRLQEQAVWKAADMVLEAFVFALIGLQLRTVVQALDEANAAALAWAAAAVLATVVLARIVWVFPATYLPRALSRRLRARDPAPPWRSVFVLSWAGMRGVVSLAAAFAIPLSTESGAAFPGRAEILFLTFVVVIGTLLLHGLTLPVLIERLGIRGREDTADRLAEASAAHNASQAAIRRLDDLVDGDGSGSAAPMTEHVAERLRTWAEQRSNSAWERLGPSGPDADETPAATWRRLRREMLAAEREVFVAERNAGRIDDEVMRRVLRELDLEEAMIERE